MFDLRRIACLMLVSAMLTACGSGGGSDASAASNQTGSTSAAGDLSSHPDVADPAAVTPAVTAHAIVSWSAPTQREDGSELTSAEIAHYEVYHINDANGDIDITEVGADSSEYSVALASGSHELGVAVVDVNGVASQVSELQTVEVN